jgi:hypothetical protein
VRSTVRIVAEITAQIGELGGQLDASFEGHPDAEILNSLPGLGMVLGARERPAAGLGSRRGGCRA